MKPKERECSICKIKIVSCTKSLICIKCKAKTLEISKILEEKEKLISLGYTIIGEPVYNKHHKRVYNLITSCCNSEYAPTFGNIRKQINSLGKAPCRFCGGRERIAAAMAGYVKKYGIDYDVKNFENYTKKVRKITESTYRVYKEIINPLDLERGFNLWHLDHKIPIMWCFKNDIDPMLVGSVNNLQMLTSLENLKKSNKKFDKEESLLLLRGESTKKIILNILGLAESNIFEIVQDYAHAYDTGKIQVRESEFLSSRVAVISRLSYAHNIIKDKIGARTLDIVELKNKEDVQFLNQWHIQGSAPRKIAFGLMNKSELLAVMTFGAPRFKQKDSDWELIRFCSHGKISVQGAASKLLKHFIKYQEPKKIVSYSLNRWGTGKMYETLGFIKTTSNQSLFYLWADNKIRSRRATVLKCKKDNIDLKTLKFIRDPGTTTWHFTNIRSILAN